MVRYAEVDVLLSGKLCLFLVSVEVKIDILRDRLSNPDCVSRGWVLHGYPTNGEEAQHLEESTFPPNRYFSAMKNLGLYML